MEMEPCTEDGKQLKFRTKKVDAIAILAICTFRPPCVMGS